MADHPRGEAADPRLSVRKKRGRFHWGESAPGRAVMDLLPYLYEGYRRLVDATSLHSEIRAQELWDHLDRGGHFIGAVLHEDVFHAPEMARGRGCVTMASFGGAGSMIARFLDRAGFLTFRGGPAYSRRGRGGRTAAQGIVEFLRNAPCGAPVGLTVDGSKGPARVVKPGIVHMAGGGGAIMVVFKTYAKRNFRLRTWDRSFIPLPFNHILTIVDGPFRIAPDADDAEVERVRLEVERALIRIADDAMGFFGQDPAKINA